MDIFQDICDELNIEGFHFDDENMASCWLHNEEIEGKLFLSLYRDYHEMMLCVSVTTCHVLPPVLTGELLQQLTLAAIEPFRGGIGIGKMPDNECLSVYKRIVLASYKSGDIIDVIAELTENAEIWDRRLLCA